MNLYVSPVVLKHVHACTCTRKHTHSCLSASMVLKLTHNRGSHLNWQALDLGLTADSGVYSELLVALCEIVGQLKKKGWSPACNKGYRIAAAHLSCFSFWIVRRWLLQSKKGTLSTFRKYLSLNAGSEHTDARGRAVIEWFVPLPNPDHFFIQITSSHLLGTWH